MKHYLVTEYQNCYVEYLVRANSVGDAKAKAREGHDDAIETVNSPVYIDSKKYTANVLDKKNEEDPVVADAIKLIDKNYEPEEIERKEKTKTDTNKEEKESGGKSDHQKKESQTRRTR